MEVHGQWKLGFWVPVCLFVVVVTLDLIPVGDRAEMRELLLTSAPSALALW